MRLSIAASDLVVVATSVSVVAFDYARFAKFVDGELEKIAIGHHSAMPRHKAASRRPLWSA
jgi:hypothetical protein